MKTTTIRSYWRGNGRYQAARASLYHLLPPQGRPPKSDCEGDRNYHLGQLAEAGWYYYDLHNNGLCNYRDQAKEFFGFDAPWKGGFTPEDEYCECCGGHRHTDSAEVDFNSPEMSKYDDALDRLVRNAAREQGINLRTGKKLNTARP